MRTYAVWRGPAQLSTPFVLEMSTHDGGKSETEEYLVNYLLLLGPAGMQFLADR